MEIENDLAVAQLLMCLSCLYCMILCDGFKV
uniref:Uncharacterized protein n=1 Tax=Rhodnius prolixus TaxID=13249 RepID=T1HTA3_RHOPR